MCYTEGIIEDILNSTCVSGDYRARYMMRESLRSLVLLAKSEQMLEIRRNGAFLTCGLGTRMNRATYIAP